MFLIRNLSGHTKGAKILGEKGNNPDWILRS